MIRRHSQPDRYVIRPPKFETIRPLLDPSSPRPDAIQQLDAVIELLEQLVADWPQRKKGVA